jgi:hypothetical protein
MLYGIYGNNRHFMAPRFRSPKYPRVVGLSSSFPLPEPTRFRIRSAEPF